MFQVITAALPSSLQLVGRKMTIRVLQLTIAGLGPSAHARDRLEEWGASLSRLDYFGGSQAEGAVGFREPVPTAAVAGTAAQAPAAASTQCGPAVLDLVDGSLVGAIRFLL